ncbi:MAG: restriction endonuclease subunit M [Oscillospiraceae bacterium]|nr:restriction endonuclease subunit M [Oscillospiraceae bacterium]
MRNKASIDISENEILKYGESLLSILLFDRTTRRNIIWGTTDYESLGEAYKAQFPITADLITGENQDIIQPRIYKGKTNQTSRTKDKAEVFTPSWMCNEQNNLIDKSWFGREGVFNIQKNKKWASTHEHIEFEDKPRKRWKDYVDAKRLEITCGEAPYLASRYDTVTGTQIKIEERIGLLDRKLRVVCENTTDEEEWMKWTIRAFQSIYGFEFQGDNLLLARENLLYTFIDYLKFKFNREPSFQELKNIADIISWNIWQMDGIQLIVPFRAMSEQYYQTTMDEINLDNQPEPCFCKIRDWRSKETMTYASLVHNKGGAH